jgi:hypothetical protein
MNPEWNATYLRQPALPTFAASGYGGGVDPVSAVAGAVEGVSSVASAWIGLKGQREQAVADEKSQRLAYKQQRESDISTQNMMTISLLQQQEAAKGRASTAKTVITGLGVVAVLAVLGFVAVQVLKQPSA